MSEDDIGGCGPWLEGLCQNFHQATQTAPATPTTHPSPARQPVTLQVSAPPDDFAEALVWKLDRLGRNTRQLLDLVDSLDTRGIHFRSLTEGLTTTGPMGKAMLTVMSAFAQLERDQLAERAKAGIAAAAARGRKGGRPTITPEAEKVQRARQYRNAGLTPPEITKLLGISRATVYRYLALTPDEATA